MLDIDYVAAIRICSVTLVGALVGAPLAAFVVQEQVAVKVIEPPSRVGWVLPPTPGPSDSHSASGALLREQQLDDQREPGSQQRPEDPPGPDADPPTTPSPSHRRPQRHGRLSHQSQKN